MIAIERERGNIQDYEIQVQNKGAVFPYAALVSLAETCDEGAQKYGIHNWLLGMQVSSVLLNHGLNHIFKYQAGDTSENHLGHALWGYMTSIHMFLKRKDMCIELLDPGYVQTSAIIQLNKETREKYHGK